MFFYYLSSYVFRSILTKMGCEEEKPVATPNIYIHMFIYKCNCLHLGVCVIRSILCFYVFVFCVKPSVQQIRFIFTSSVACSFRVVRYLETEIIKRESIGPKGVPKENHKGTKRVPKVIPKATSTPPFPHTHKHPRGAQGVLKRVRFIPFSSTTLV